MYCPKCNQQQVSDEMRFCSRCGFPLTGVAMLLDHNGIIPQLNSGPDQKSQSSRSQIIREGAYLTLVAWAVAFVAMLFLNFGGPFEVLALIATILFFIVGLIGFIRFAYGFLFVKDSARTALSDESRELSFSEPARRASLPSQQSLPVSDYPRRTNTKAMASPPSVTENTTRLLDEQTSNQNK